MTKAIVQNGKLHFSSLLTEFRFLKAAEGKEVSLEIKDRPTSEMRKYFEGCLVPAFFYFHPFSGWESFADAREIIKLEYLPNCRVVKGLDEKWVKIAPSTAELSKERFTAFVDAITDWMTDNGMPNEVLDPEAYKHWRDTNFVDLIYPPLARLKQSYDRAQIEASEKITPRPKAKARRKAAKRTRRPIQ